MTDSNWTSFDSSLFIALSFTMVVVLAALSGFGVIQEEAGDPPQLLEENESLVTYSTGGVPERPGSPSEWQKERDINYSDLSAYDNPSGRGDLSNDDVYGWTVFNGEVYQIYIWDERGEISGGTPRYGVVLYNHNTGGIQHSVKWYANREGIPLGGDFDNKRETEFDKAPGEGDTYTESIAVKDPEQYTESGDPGKVYIHYNYEVISQANHIYNADDVSETSSNGWTRFEIEPDDPTQPMGAVWQLYDYQNVGDTFQDVVYITGEERPPDAQQGTPKSITIQSDNSQDLSSWTAEHTIPPDDSVSDGTYELKAYQDDPSWDVPFIGGLLGSGESLAQTVAWIGAILVYFFVTVVTFIVQSVLGVIKLIVYGFKLMWWVTSGWFSISAAVTDSFAILGILIQIPLIGLSLVAWNVVAKIIKMAPYT